MSDDGMALEGMASNGMANDDMARDCLACDGMALDAIWHGQVIYVVTALPRMPGPVKMWPVIT
jgi:hypothetical protein